MTVRKFKTNARRKRPTVAIVTAALNQAAQDAVEAHQRAGQPLVGWKNGKIVLISPDSVETTTKTSKRRRRKAS